MRTAKGVEHKEPPDGGLVDIGIGTKDAFCQGKIGHRRKRGEESVRSVMRLGIRVEDALKEPADRHRATAREERETTSVGDDEVRVGGRVVKEHRKKRAGFAAARWESIEHGSFFHPAPPFFVHFIVSNVRFAGA